MKNLIISFITTTLLSSIVNSQTSINLEFKTEFETPILPYLFYHATNANNIQLNELDKKKLANYIRKHIKDTSDYINALFIEEEFTPINKKDYYQVNNTYYNKRENDYFKYPYQCINGKIISKREVPKIDPETGEDAVDEDGVFIYIETQEEEAIEERLKGILSTENWEIKKGKFIKATKVINSLLIVHDDNGDIKPGCRISFTKLVEKKSKINKKELFKKNISYDYIFNPAMYTKDGLKKLREGSGTTVDLLYFQENAKQNSDLTKHETDQLIKELVYQIQKENLNITDNNNNHIKYDDSLLTTSELLRLIDEETGKEKVDERGNFMYIKSISPYHLSDYCGLHFEEDWYFAKNQYDIVKKVNTVSFIVQSYDSNGNLIGHKTLPFKIKFEH